MHLQAIDNQTPLIAATEVTKYYDQTLALDRLNLTLLKGEIVGLLGPNGAGKTTAIHIFLGLLAPTSGDLAIMGMNPLKQRALISGRLNFSSAYVQLPSNLKVLENLQVFSRLYGVENPRQKIDELLQLFEMTPLANRLTGVLSSGEKTRLNLCKCFLNDPELLLLDEPTSSLDPEMADTVRKILKRIQREKNLGIIVTSHNMLEVEEMCDRVLFIHQGRTIAQGHHDELKREYGGKSLEAVFIKLVRK